MILKVFVFMLGAVQLRGSVIHNQKNILISYNYPTYCITDDKGEVYIRTGQLQEFKIVPALNGKRGAISFQSTTKPSHYLRHSNWLAHVHPYHGSQLYKDDASYYEHKNKFLPGYSAFESCNYRNHYLRHQGYRLKITPQSNTHLYKMDASFLAASYVSINRRIQSKNYPAYHWGINEHRIWITKKDTIRPQIITPGLTGQKDTVSFYLPGKQAKYIRHRSYVIIEDKPKSVQPDLYRKEATFRVETSKYYPGYMSFESVIYPGMYIRPNNYSLYLNKYSKGDKKFRGDTSFNLSV